MNSSFLSVFISFCFIVLIPEISSAQKADLKLRLNKGSHHIYTIYQENQAIEDGKPIEVEQKITLKIDHQILNQLPNGNYQVEVLFKRFSIAMKHITNVIRYDSDTVDVSNPLYKTLNFLTDVKLNYEVTPEGVVSKLVGFEPIKKQLEKDARLGNLLRNFGSEHFILELYNYIPRKEVEAGEKWKASVVLPDLNDLNCDVQYLLKEITPKNLKLTQEASFQMTSDLPVAPDGTVAKVDEKGTQAGSLVIDTGTNMRLSSQVIQSVNVLLTTQKASPEGKSVRNLKLVTKTSFELVRK